MKTCIKCFEPKPLEEFGPDKRADDGKKGTCRKCFSAYMTEWNRQHRDKFKVYQKRYKERNKEKVLATDRLAKAAYRKKYPDRYEKWNTDRRCRKYGTTKDWLDEQTKRQNGRCAICGELPSGRGLCIDHCHITGNVRELLCTGCNTGLHKMERSLEWFRQAEEYLRRHDASTNN